MKVKVSTVMSAWKCALTVHRAVAKRVIQHAYTHYTMKGTTHICRLFDTLPDSVTKRYVSFSEAFFIEGGAIGQQVLS